MKLRVAIPSPIFPIKFTRTVTKVTQSIFPVLDLGQKPFHRQKSPWTQQKHGLVSLLGIHVVYDISRKPWDRVVQLKVLCTKCRVPIYEPLEMDKVYKVTLPSYLVNGGDGFQMIKDELLKHDSGDQDISVVSEYISKMKVVYPAVEGRIKFSAASHYQGSFPLIILSFWAVILVLYQ